MRKVAVFLICFFTIFSVTSADYLAESINRFVNSPSAWDLEKIEDEFTRYCEQIFLEAYRRRDFTEEENLICSDFFAKKIEDELNYMKKVFSERWIY